MNLDNIITIEEISNLRKYTCNISKSTIIFEIKNKFLLFNYVEFYWEYPKLVLHLLKYSFDDMIKKNNFDKFKYLISQNDYKHLDKENWTVIKDEDDCVELECPVESAFENIMQGFVNIL